MDMSGNSITGLPNPVDRDATANKNYVDNGGAIAKNPDGSFTAVSNIDFIDYRLKKFLIQRMIEMPLKLMRIKNYLFHHSSVQSLL